MKKIALTLLFLFLITPCMANIHINPSTVESVVKEFVPADKMVSVISEYNNQIKQSNDTGISAQVLWDICAIAGWDIKKTDGKNQCKEFVYELVRKASIKFNPACDKQYKGKPGYICVDDFFTNKFYGGTQVNLTPALTLAKEYIRIQHNDNSAQCKTTNPREIKVVMGATDYGVQCTSHNQNVYYELIFDNVKEHKDQTIKNSIQNAICRMYDAKPITAGCTGGGTNVSGTAPVTCWSATCAADSAKCEKINQSMAKFGYIAEYKNGKCEINFDTVTKREDLKTAYGIDNFVFCHGIQVANIPNAETYLKQYVAERAGVSESSVKCDSGFNTYTGTGCARNGITDLNDYIKTCHVGNNQIDFVFDDINEKKKKTIEGGLQAMSCIVTGGTYSGERCIGLGEKQCNILRQSNLKECPECKAARWDKDTESCILPSSKSAQNLQKGVNIGLIVGGAVVGVVLTVVTAGAAGAPVTAIVLTAIETVGAGIELTSQSEINGIADDFLVESNKCKNATCAKEMLSQNLQRMANYANDMTAAEADAVDTEMARLANLIPDDDEIWATILVNGTDMADNKLGFWESWEPEQVWRAVGIGLQLASVITGITKWISKSSRIAKSTAAIKQKFARAIQSIDNAPESTLRAKRLELKQLAKNGKKVSKADDAADAAKARKIANADSPESEAGFADMMNRVDESNARNITTEDIEAEFVRRQAAEGGKYTKADITERMKNYNDYHDERMLLDANGQPVVNKKGETQYMDTQRMYTQDGVYTEERQKIHEAILDDLFKDADKAKPAAGEQPTFVMLGGRGGSGKSSLDGIAYDRSRSIVIDADDIKTKLPEYKNLVDSHSEYAGLNAWEVHEESSDIVKEALDMARERGINVVLDGTMSSAGSALKKITPFEDAGYRIEGAYMYLPREESTVRAMGRGMGEGRFVPTDVLLNMKDNEKAFGEVSGHFDSWSIWTTEGLQKGEVPNMIGHSEGLSVFEKPVNPDLSAPLTGIIKE